MNRWIHEAFEKKPSVVIIGDLMLDRYIIGKAHRISPEAPVPVLLVEETRDELGGAGNVARNLAGMGTDLLFIGGIGNDSAGEDIRKILKNGKIPAELFSLASRPTTVKTRIASQGQQLVRVDSEKTGDLSSSELDGIEKVVFDSLLKTYSAIALSDYGKGFCHFSLCRKIITYGQENKIPVVVDPKGDDWDKYRGAYLLTPNLNELSLIYGKPIDNSDNDILKAGLVVKNKFNIQNLLVTRSEKGMTLINSKGEKFHLHTEAIDVFDVSGAGDTVVAALTWLLAAGLPLEKAMAGANKAAGIAVAHWGTYPVAYSEIAASFEQSIIKLPEFGVIPFHDAEKLGITLREAGEQVVFTNGCFDLLHAGHITYLERAKREGDILIVGINSDASVHRLKGEGRPVNTIETRAVMMSAIRFVDYVVVFEEDTPWELLNVLRPDVLVKGGDYSIDKIIGSEFAGETKVIPFVDGFSSSSIIERIKNSG
jgi:D-beta-D-heptose 7-phosphate kinase / D-beta-D-heptose 1-phosphate adenosyltransferase